MDIALLYLKENLNFSQTLFGYFKGLDNFLRGITLITVLPLVKRFTSIRDLPLVLVGFISFAVNFVVLGVASTQWMVFLAAVLGMLKGVPSAGIRAMMSSMVSQDEQGRLFGIVAASESIITLIASVLFNELYPATVHIFPGLCYMLGAGLILLMFLLILYLHCTLPSDMPQMSYQTVVEDPQLQISDSDIPSSLTAEA
ncbi:proton-coupled folate transporter isoform X2 [Aplysia californica]|nr:proton-coupled folate transporter isoform X2 [Aplysia californica]